MLIRALQPQLDVVLGDCADVRPIPPPPPPTANDDDDLGDGGSPHLRRQRRRRQPWRPRPGDHTVETSAAGIRPLRGSPAFYSPEVLRLRAHAGSGDDVWALGVSLLGMLAQWPSLSLPGGDGRSEVRRYPRRCWSHAQALARLNPRHDLVVLVVRMLAWDLDSRASASECADMIRQLPPELDNAIERRGAGALAIEAPADFRPISFW